jgi:hypothetical protein
VLVARSLAPGARVRVRRDLPGGDTRAAAIASLGILVDEEDLTETM